MSGLKLKIKIGNTAAPSASQGQAPSSTSDQSKKRKHDEPTSASKSAGEPPKKQHRPAPSCSGVSASTATPTTGGFKLKIKPPVPSTSQPSAKSAVHTPTLHSAPQRITVAQPKFDTPRSQAGPSVASHTPRSHGSIGHRPTPPSRAAPSHPKPKPKPKPRPGAGPKPGPAHQRSIPPVGGVTKPKFPSIKIRVPGAARPSNLGPRPQAAGEALLPRRQSTDHTMHRPRAQPPKAGKISMNIESFDYDPEAFLCVFFDL